MSHLFHEAARTIDLPLIRECKKDGTRVVGYTCSFLPVEVFHAAGILPVRLRGIHAETMNIGDAYYGPFVCTFPKALLQKAGEGEYTFLDGAVITAGCDGMRRIDECWRKMGSDIEGTLPDWFYYLDLPHKPDGVSFEWYESRIRKLIKAVENQFGVTVTDEKLREAIKTQNDIREAVWELNRLRHGETVRISGTEAFEAMIARTVLPPDVYRDELRRLIEDVTSRTTSVSDGKKRLFLAGSICDDLDLVSRIEEAGALVVGETLCYGIRNTCERVDEDRDRKSTRLNSSHRLTSRMPSSA
jgi:benzoyl-CoA reductase/2-hydroxyglutaryl-CoA dehydratase subunit BcrC/BadD/HgdB